MSIALRPARKITAPNGKATVMCQCAPGSMDRETPTPRTCMSATRVRNSAVFQSTVTHGAPSRAMATQTHLRRIGDRAARTAPTREAAKIATAARRKKRVKDYSARRIASRTSCQSSHVRLISIDCLFDTTHDRLINPVKVLRVVRRLGLRVANHRSRANVWASAAVALERTGRRRLHARVGPLLVPAGCRLRQGSRSEATGRELRASSAKPSSVWPRWSRGAGHRRACRPVSSDTHTRDGLRQHRRPYRRH
jgi:hypothetical protein